MGMTTKKTPNKIIENGNVITNLNEIAETINKYFTTKINVIKKNTKKTN